MRLLVVEDAESVRLRLVDMLSGHDVLVQSAATLAEARALLTDEPDLLSLDLQLPDGSGLELIDFARKLNPRPIIYVLTGASELTDSALARGADQVFRKASDIPAYLNAIDALIRARGSVPSSDRSEEAL